MISTAEALIVLFVVPTSDFVLLPVITSTARTFRLSADALLSHHLVQLRRLIAAASTVPLIKSNERFLGFPGLGKL